MDDDHKIVEDNKHGHDIDDLDGQAVAALEHRAEALAKTFIDGARTRLETDLHAKNASKEERKAALDRFNHRCDELISECKDKGHAVYEDAIERRGRRQAALDQLQGAVGLPLDPVLRQAEIERRERDLNPAPETVPVTSMAFASAVHNRLLSEDDDEEVFQQEPEQQPPVPQSTSRKESMPNPFGSGDSLTPEQRRRRDALLSG